MDRRNALKGIGMSLGYVVATPTLVNMLQSCRADASSWLPTFFTTNEGVVIKNLIDLILPTTEDTPGALEVNVPEFLDLYASKVYTEEKQNNLKEGIKAIMTELNISNEKKVNLKTENYNTLLSKYLKANKAQLDDFKSNQGDSNALDTLKRLRDFAVWAYKTSEQVGETVLAYDPVPGKQLGCISLEEATGGKSWSL